MKAKLLYLIPGWTIDSHIHVLAEYARVYELTVFLVLEHRSDKYKFSIDWINRFAAEKGLDIRIYKRPHRIRDFRNLFFLLKMFIRARAGRYSLVYSEAGDDLYSALLSVLFLRKRNTIQGVHNASFHTDHGSFLMKFPHLLIRRWFTCFRLYSEEQQRIFRTQYPRAKTYMARIPYTSAPDEEQRIKKDPLVFLFAGHIYPYKGVDLLITAANRLRKKYADFKVVIAGSCTDWSSYAALIEDPAVFELEISFIGEDRIMDYFKHADFLVLPYRDVTQSGILTLGYSTGLPAIVSDCPGFSEYVKDRVSGYLFNTGSADSLEMAMENAIQLDAIGYDKMVQSLAAFTRHELSAESIARINEAFMNGLIVPHPAVIRDQTLKPEVR